MPSSARQFNVSTLAPGNYSYYVTYYNSVTGEESRPTPLIGPQSITLDGREIQLSNLPTPSAGSGFDQVRIYRNTSTNSSNFYLDATVAAGTNNYVDGASDASISGNAANQPDRPADHGRHQAGRPGAAQRQHLRAAVRQCHPDQLHADQGGQHPDDQDPGRHVDDHGAGLHQLRRPGVGHSALVGRLGESDSRQSRRQRQHGQQLDPIRQRQRPAERRQHRPGGHHRHQYRRHDRPRQSELQTPRSKPSAPGRPPPISWPTIRSAIRSTSASRRCWRAPTARAPPTAGLPIRARTSRQSGRRNRGWHRRGDIRRGRKSGQRDQRHDLGRPGEIGRRAVAVQA